LIVPVLMILAMAVHGADGMPTSGEAHSVRRPLYGELRLMGIPWEDRSILGGE